MIVIKAINKNNGSLRWFDITWGQSAQHGKGYIPMLPWGEELEPSKNLDMSDNRIMCDPSDYRFVSITDELPKVCRICDTCKKTFLGFPSKIPPEKVFCSDKCYEIFENNC